MKATVTITRASDDTFRIVVRDEASNICFVKLTMQPADFAMAISSLAERPAEMEVCGLQHVGRRLVVEHREILCPIKTYDKSALQAWLADNAQDDGWVVRTNLKSQGSVEHRPDGTLLRYTAWKYVDDSEAVK